ncbi:TRADD-N-associated membrane domain-containing protein [Amycolatopsis camponoti]|uniref:TRADD-N-associated membrane domain-containing protein n=1 Tax=Amycolatopsis camponoti TaxID=2606593 RepID=UPI0012D70B27|nr:hypothetical protein [Amycolatopsis camponoti]
MAGNAPPPRLDYWTMPTASPGLPDERPGRRLPPLARVIAAAVTAGVVAACATYIFKTTSDFGKQISVSVACASLVLAIGSLVVTMKPMLTAEENHAKAVNYERERLRLLTSSDSTLAATVPQDVRFTTLLIEYYAHGLVEARSSSASSRRSSWLGMSVIVIGVLLAVVSGTSEVLGNGVQISLIVSASGVVTNAVGILFHRQANKALAHMEKQTSSLQKDMWSDQGRAVAIDLIDRVSSQELRDKLLADVALELANAGSRTVEP